MTQPHLIIEHPQNQTRRQDPMPLAAGAPVPPRAFAQIRRSMVLDYCKWDPQVGDVNTLANFPLIISADTWRTLASLAEALAAETVAAEDEMLGRPELLQLLGLPKKIRLCLGSASHSKPTRAAARTMRFDFHWTTDGWRISEVNSDVPGGFTEASHFTRMMSDYYAGHALAGDPLSGWARAISKSASNNGIVALLSAPGFMEDHQIMACLSRKLAEHGCECVLANPRQITWHNARAFLGSPSPQTALAALVRFYQAEWLAALPPECGWSHFFCGGLTPVANPGQGIIAESKRFPLTWPQLQTPLPAWRALLPETRDPRDVPWESDDRWLLKSAFCNTGDTVSIRSLVNSRQWNATVRDVRRHPENWVAQEKFETPPINTPSGTMFPCIGVYTVNGRAAGAYARIAPRPWINFEATDIALLVAKPSIENAHA